MNKITDASKDKKYFTIVPRLVWALSRSTYDLTLWSVIKDIAGEDGECILNTSQLAILSMMSEGKVSDCRAYLIKSGLLKGEVIKDPDQKQPCWHLKIPDIWKKNIEWAQKYAKIKDRLQYKLDQKKSLHPMKASPGEDIHSPHEGSPKSKGKKPSPGETKKKGFKEPKEEKIKKLPFKINPDLDAKLDKVKAHFKETMPLNGYNEMVAPLIVKSLNGKTLTLVCLNIHHQNWIEGRVINMKGYLTVFRSHFDNINLKIKLVLMEEL